MTGRLIDADALHTSLVKMNDFGELSAKKAIRMVSKAPTVDAEPITRCKNCKHNKNNKWVDCPVTEFFGRTLDNYCSLAERKEE